MNYQDLVKAISDELDMSQKSVKETIADIVTVLVDLADDQPVNITGFGTLKADIRKARKSYNPGKKVYMLLPPKRVLKFIPSSLFKDAVQEKGAADE